MKSSFNAYGKTKKEYGTLHIPIWLGTVVPIPVGGVLDDDFKIDGILVQAGTPINITDKVITPLVAFKVVSYTAATDGDYDTIVIKPAEFGPVSIIPEAGDMLQKLGATFAALGKAAEVVAVTALTGADAGKYSFTVDKTANLGSLSANDILVYSASDAAGSDKAMANQPNSYLYHDIWLGDLDVADSDTFATGAAVQYHPDGILISRTPAGDVAGQMAAAVPGVLQVKE